MKTILLVEDDPSIQDAMQLVFLEPEYRLLVCSRAEEVLRRNKLVPDIYLIDKRLSGYNGLELCRMLKSDEKTKNVPVIILSALPNIKELAAEAGADGAIEKPFKIQLLLEKILMVLSLYDQKNDIKKFLTI
jgi:DNA-binding response OmpR family regulator